MGLLDTIRNALGFQRPLVPRDPHAPLALTDAAEARLQALGDHGIHLSTHESPLGRGVTVEEGAVQGPAPEPLAPWAITASDGDLAALSGLLLDFRDGRWAVTVDLELRARDTPNPHSRLYLCDHWLALGKPRFFVAKDGNPSLADALLSIEGVSAVLFRDNTVTVERDASASWEPIDGAVDRTLRQYFLACGKALTEAELAPSDSPFEAEVRAVLEEKILPGVHRDGGDIDLVSVQDGVALVRMSGACRGCPASTMTLQAGVLGVLKEAFPDRIQRVEQV